MAEKTEDKDKKNFSGLDRWLTFAVLLGPLAALANLDVTYSLAPSACADGSKTMMHFGAAAFFVVSLLGALIGWRHHRDDVTGIVSEDRVRWMAVSAIGLSILSALTIVAMEIPNIILRSCD